MNAHHPSPPALIVSRLIVHPQRWVWSVFILSTLICAMVVWLHVQQRQTLESALSELEDRRLVRIDPGKDLPHAGPDFQAYTADTQDRRLLREISERLDYQLVLGLSGAGLLLAIVCGLVFQARLTGEAPGTTSEMTGDRLQHAIEASNDGLWDWNVATNEIHYSRSYWRMLDYVPDGFTGRPQMWTDLLHPDDHERTLAVSRDCVENRTQSFEVEFRLRAKDGQWKWILGRGRAVDRDPQGQALRIIGTDVDITERKQAEDKLRYISRLYALLSQINQAIIRTKDDGELFRTICQEAIEFGHFRMAWVGLFDEADNRIRPATFAGHEDGYLERIAITVGETPTGKGPTGAAFQQSRIMTCSDIATDPRMAPWRDEALKRGYRSSAAVPFRRRGKAVGTLNLYAAEPGFFTADELEILREIGDDISFALDAILSESERKKAEKELQQFKTIFDTANFGAAITDLNGVLTYVNVFFAAAHGYEPEELPGRPLQLMHNDSQLEQVESLLRQLAETGACNAREVGHCRRDGSEFPMLMTGMAVRDAYGLPHCFTLTAIDLTERKTLENQLLQARKMESVGRLAGGVAHDFNNMLSVILGYVGIALEQTDPALPLHEDLLEIRKAAEHSTNLTRQLLAFARRQTVAPKVLDLNDTVEGMLKILRRLIGEDINLIWLPADDLWPIKIDPSQIDQILANLCVNARDAIADVGRLTIETGNALIDAAYCAYHAGFLPGEFVVLTVSDSGCGMDQATLAQVFEPFFTTKGMGQGTGLGLATVYGIVKQNNGFVNVYSEPGNGTTFSIYLPRHSGEHGIVPRIATTAGLPSGQGEVVLLVEDDPSILKMTRKMLEMQGYIILPASDPGEAIRLAEESDGRIDLLITDVVMPEMNGRDLAASLHSRYPAIKTLFMSGYTANVIAHRGILDDGVHFIQKPFSKTEIAGKIWEVLGKA